MPEQTDRQLKVFLSYVHEDEDRVRALYKRLRRARITSWFDKEDIIAGTEWESQILKAVQDADVVLVCLSKQINRDGYIHKEMQIVLDMALQKRPGSIFIVPVRLEACDVLESLKKWQWVDLFHDKDPRGWNSLMRALQKRADDLGVPLNTHKPREPKASDATNKEHQEANLPTSDVAISGSNSVIVSSKLSSEQIEERLSRAREYVKKYALVHYNYLIPDDKANSEIAAKTTTSSLEISKPESQDVENSTTGEIAKPEDEVQTENTSGDTSTADIISFQPEEETHTNDAENTALVDQSSSSDVMVVGGHAGDLKDIRAINHNYLSPETMTSESVQGLPTDIQNLRKRKSNKTQPRFKLDAANAVIIAAVITCIGAIVAAAISSPILESWLARKPDNPSLTQTALVNAMNLRITRVTATATWYSIPTATQKLSATPTKASFFSKFFVSRTPRPTFSPPETPTLISNSEITMTPVHASIVDPAGISMQLVPAGDFVSRNTNQSFYLESFYIDTYEVTNSAYQECERVGPCSRPDYDRLLDVNNYYRDPQYAAYPVVYVSFSDASTYCIWRGARLPSSYEWEKAAQGAHGEPYPWGTQKVTCDLANYGVCKKFTSKVGSYEAGKSPYGVYDIIGNVFEWADNETIHGGGWGFPWFTANAYYSDSYPGSADNIGFRCAKDANP
jgi:formylglycine-generating enzyme required for sulfatase activity